MPLERRDEAEELGRPVACGCLAVVRGRAGACSWRVTSAVPGVVRKADIQIQPAPWVVPRRLGRVSVDLPPTGKVNSKPLHRGKVNSNRGKVRQTIYLLFRLPGKYSSGDLALAVAGYQIVQISVSVWAATTSRNLQKSNKVARFARFYKLD